MPERQDLPGRCDYCASSTHATHATVDHDSVIDLGSRTVAELLAEGARRHREQAPDAPRALPRPLPKGPFPKVRIEPLADGVRLTVSRDGVSFESVILGRALALELSGRLEDLARELDS